MPNILEIGSSLSDSSSDDDFPIPHTVSKKVYYIPRPDRPPPPRTTPPSQAVYHGPREVTVEEILGVENWKDLPKGQRRAYLLKLRAINAGQTVRTEKRECPPSPGLDTLDPRVVSAKLKNISVQPDPRSYSDVPQYPPLRPPFENYNADSLDAEFRSHMALIKEGGIPSHPVGFGFDIDDPPEEYKGVILYWKWVGNPLQPITEQLRRWRNFRNWQREVRRYYEYLRDFESHQIKTRDFCVEKGLDKVELPVDCDEHKKLANWTEYSFHEGCYLEELKEQLADAESKLGSTEASMPKVEIHPFDAFDHENHFDIWYKLSLPLLEQDNKIAEDIAFAELDLTLAQKRRYLAQSILGDTVPHGLWTNLARVEIDERTFELATITDIGKPSHAWSRKRFDRWFKVAESHLLAIYNRD